MNKKNKIEDLPTNHVVEKFEILYIDNINVEHNNNGLLSIWSLGVMDNMDGDPMGPFICILA